MKAINFLIKNIYIFFFIIYFLLGFQIVSDYGISTDEEFQRFSGFYWLCYVLDFLPFENLKFLASQKLESIGGPTLPNPAEYPFYGVVFDLPLALIETILNINNSYDYFLLRHKVNFLVFFLSSIFFYKILKIRFLNKIIIFLGVLLYISSPRIFGDSFYNNKDLIFLSLVTISFYYYLCFIKYKNFKDLFLFSLISALATSLRVIGVFLPFSFTLFLITQKNSSKNKLFYFLSYLIIFILFLILFWPYLWSAPFSNLSESFEAFSSFKFLSIKVLFNGEYFFTHFLPISYLPTWIFITTPIVTLILFLIGYLFIVKRLFYRTINIKSESSLNDFWRGSNEKFDLFVFVNFSLIFFYIIFTSPILYTGWRHLYFLHPMMIYLSCIALLQLNKKKYEKLFFSIIFLFTLLNFYELKRFHPYQSLYFNQIVKDSKKNDFEIDYWGIAGVKFLNEIINLEKKSNQIKIGVASYVPLHRSLKLLSENKQKKLKIIGQDFQNSDYIFHNNISEVNNLHDKKYSIPSDFEKLSSFSINKFIVYEIFKKK